MDYGTLASSTFSGSRDAAVRNSTENASMIATRDLVGKMANPEFYPERCAAVEVKETHLSYIFLTNRAVYKLKKPVHKSFIDLSTTKARELNARAELALNSRLAVDVYWGVVPVTKSKSGGLVLGGEGPATDWLVKMRRLPDDRMLDKLLRSGRVTSNDLEQLCRSLSSFYSRSSHATMSPDEYLHRLTTRLDQEYHRLLRPDLDMPRDDLQRLVHELRQMLQADFSLFKARVIQEAIVEGHGDLRPEHICLEDHCVIFDCLEFSRDLRVMDYAEELAYLSLECLHLGASDLGNQIFDIYCSVSKARIPEIVRCFYACYRALLRSRLCIWHVYDCPSEKHEHWRREAYRYLQTAALILGEVR